MRMLIALEGLASPAEQLEEEKQNGRMARD